MNQGRCKTCRVRFLWTEHPWDNDSGVREGHALCPRCGRVLSRTTTASRAPVERVAVGDVDRRGLVCGDCGQTGESTGHQTCPEPGRASEEGPARPPLDPHGPWGAP